MHAVVTAVASAGGRDSRTVSGFSMIPVDLYISPQCSFVFINPLQRDFANCFTLLMSLGKVEDSIVLCCIDTVRFSVRVGVRL